MWLLFEIWFNSVVIGFFYFVLFCFVCYFVYILFVCLLLAVVYFVTFSVLLLGLVCLYG